MAADKKFDNAVVGTETVTTADFVTGSGTYSRKVKFAEVYTADGKLHQAPIQVEGDASFEVYGCNLDLNSPVGLAVTITLKEGSNTFATLSGLASMSWKESDNKTKVDIKATPTVDTKA